MKSTFLKLSSLAIALTMLMGIVVSCDKKPDLTKMDEVERADYMIAALDNESVDSYTVDMSAKITGNMYGVSVQVNIDGDFVYTGALTDTPSNHQEMKMNVKADNNSVGLTVDYESVSGYRDGKMYKKETKDGKSCALVSSVSPEDYKKHEQAVNDVFAEDFDEILKSASTKKSEPRGDGKWNITLSGYTEDAIQKLTDELFSDIGDFTEGYKISDITVKAGVTEELLPIDMGIDMAFERVDTDKEYTEPKVSFVIEYNDMGTATLPEIDLSKYKEVADLAGFIEIQKLLSDYGDSADISFVSANESTVSYMGTQQDTKEIDDVKAETKDGKYTFDVKATVNPGTSDESEVDITYSNGKFTMKGEGMETQTQEMDEASAREYIGNLVDPADLSGAYISDMKLDEDGYTHVFTISDSDYSAFQEAYAAYDAKNFKAEAEVAVKYENGVISEYKYDYNLTATVQNNKMEVTVSADIKFSVSADKNAG